jgi:MFS family permease
MRPIELPVSERTNRTLVITLALSMLLASLGTSIANIALPSLAAAFSAPFHQVQWVVIAYLAALTASVVLVGRLGDRHGLRRVHMAGLALFAVASILCGLAPNLWFLVGARTLQGIAAAVLTTLPMALMRASASEARIGRAMGLLGTMSALGTALGPTLGGLLLGGLLLGTSGWRGIFLILVPMALLALLLAIVSLPADASRQDLRRQPRGIRPGRELLRGLLLNVVVAAVMMTTLVVGPFYLGLGLGLKEAVIGLVMSVGPVASILSGVPSGRLVDAWGYRRVLAIGLAMLATGCLALALLPEPFGVMGYAGAILILTPGYQLFQAANNAGVLVDAAQDQRGAVSGLLGLSRNVGLVLGASVMSGVFALAVGNSDFAQGSPLKIGRGMQLTFLLAAGLMLAALVAALRHPASATPAPAKEGRASP